MTKFKNVVCCRIFDDTISVNFMEMVFLASDRVLRPMIIAKQLDIKGIDKAATPRTNLVKELEKYSRHSELVEKRTSTGASTAVIGDTIDSVSAVLATGILLQKPKIERPVAKERPNILSKRPRFRPQQRSSSTDSTSSTSSSSSQALNLSTRSYEATAPAVETNIVEPAEVPISAAAALTIPNPSIIMSTSIATPPTITVTSKGVSQVMVPVSTNSAFPAGPNDVVVPVGNGYVVYKPRDEVSSGVTKLAAPTSSLVGLQPSSIATPNLCPQQVINITPGSSITSGSVFSSGSAVMSGGAISSVPVISQSQSGFTSGSMFPSGSAITPGIAISSVPVISQNQSGFTSGRVFSSGSVITPGIAISSVPVISQSQSGLTSGSMFVSGSAITSGSAISSVPIISQSQSGFTSGNVFLSGSASMSGSAISSVPFISQNQSGLIFPSGSAIRTGNALSTVPVISQSQSGFTNTDLVSEIIARASLSVSTPASVFAELVSVTTPQTNVHVGSLKSVFTEPAAGLLNVTVAQSSHSVLTSESTFTVPAAGRLNILTVPKTSSEMAQCVSTRSGPLQIIAPASGNMKAPISFPCIKSLSGSTKPALRLVHTKSTLPVSNTSVSTRSASGSIVASYKSSLPVSNSLPVSTRSASRSVVAFSKSSLAVSNSSVSTRSASKSIVAFSKSSLPVSNSLSVSTRSASRSTVAISKSSLPVSNSLPVSTRFASRSTVAISKSSLPVSNSLSVSPRSASKSIVAFSKSSLPISIPQSGLTRHAAGLVKTSSASPSLVSQLSSPKEMVVRPPVSFVNIKMPPSSLPMVAKTHLGDQVVYVSPTATIVHSPVQSSSVTQDPTITVSSVNVSKPSDVTLTVPVNHDQSVLQHKAAVQAGHGLKQRHLVITQSPMEQNIDTKETLSTGDHLVSILKKPFSELKQNEAELLSAFKNSAAGASKPVTNDVDKAISVTSNLESVSTGTVNKVESLNTETVDNVPVSNLANTYVPVTVDNSEPVNTSTGKLKSLLPANNVTVASSPYLTLIPTPVPASTGTYLQPPNVHPTYLIKNTSLSVSLTSIPSSVTNTNCVSTVTSCVSDLNRPLKLSDTGVTESDKDVIPTVDSTQVTAANENEIVCIRKVILPSNSMAPPPSYNTRIGAPPPNSHNMRIGSQTIARPKNPMLIGLDD